MLTSEVLAFNTPPLAGELAHSSGDVGLCGQRGLVTEGSRAVRPTGRRPPGSTRTRVKPERPPEDPEGTLAPSTGLPRRPDDSAKTRFFILLFYSLKESFMNKTLLKIKKRPLGAVEGSRPNSAWMQPESFQPAPIHLQLLIAAESPFCFGQISGKFAGTFQSRITW